MTNWLNSNPFQGQPTVVVVWYDGSKAQRDQLVKVLGSKGVLIKEAKRRRGEKAPGNAMLIYRFSRERDATGAARRAERLAGFVQVFDE